MLLGPRRVSKDKNIKGLTLIEVLLAVLLMAVVFLAVSALYVASQRFYFTASDKAVIGYELEYAIAHIYKNTMTGRGDNTDPPIEIAAGNLEFTVRRDDANVTYKIDTTTQELLFDGNGDGVFEETLASKVNILSADGLSSFTSDDNALMIKLTGEYPEARAYTEQRMTVYGACYPRLASFH